jgi:hypothetical protein
MHDRIITIKPSSAPRLSCPSHGVTPGRLNPNTSALVLKMDLGPRHYLRTALFCLNDWNATTGDGGSWRTKKRGPAKTGPPVSLNGFVQIS